MRFEPVRVISLAICLGLAAGPARGQDDASSAAEFDDDFGQAPAAAEQAGPPDEPAEAPPFDEEEPAAEAAPPEAEEETAFVHNTVEGLTGGVHAVDARSGKPHSFRLALAFDFFRNQGWLAPDSLHRHGGTALSLNVTPIEHLELAAQLSVVGNADEAGTPSVIQVVGDARLLAKGYGSVKR